MSSESNPLIGVGVGSQPLAAQEEAASRASVRRDTSHTTPLTVAAELGIVGIAAYLAWFAGAVRHAAEGMEARRDGRARPGGGVRSVVRAFALLQWLLRRPDHLGSARDGGGLLAARSSSGVMPG